MAGHLRLGSSTRVPGGSPGLGIQEFTDSTEKDSTVSLSCLENPMDRDSPFLLTFSQNLALLVIMNKVAMAFWSPGRAHRGLLGPLPLCVWSPGLAHRGLLGPLPLCVWSPGLAHRGLLGPPAPLLLEQMSPGAASTHAASNSWWVSASSQAPPCLPVYHISTSHITTPAASFTTPCIIFSFLSVILRKGLRASVDS